MSDIDGVWTDGGMYYSDSGVEFKKFNTYDSAGILLARSAGLETIIISGEQSESVVNRAAKLGISEVHLGVKDKLTLAHKIISATDVKIDQVAYIGDDINDFQLLKSVGFSGCPQSAPSYIKEIVDIVVPTDGGAGAFRDFVIEILKRKGIFESVLRRITNGQEL